MYIDIFPIEEVEEVKIVIPMSVRDFLGLTKTEQELALIDNEVHTIVEKEVRNPISIPCDTVEQVTKELEKYHRYSRISFEATIPFVYQYMKDISTVDGLLFAIDTDIYKDEFCEAFQIFMTLTYAEKEFLSDGNTWEDLSYIREEYDGEFPFTRYLGLDNLYQAYCDQIGGRISLYDARNFPEVVFQKYDVCRGHNSNYYYVNWDAKK